MGKRIHDPHNTTKAAQPARDLNHAEKLRAAIAMRKAGHEWQTIADQLGIKGGKGAAYNMVNDALKKEKREGLAELRELEVGRLDNLWAVYYPKALEGDGWSFDRCLRLSERRASLLGLDMPKASGDGNGNGPQTIVQAVHPAWAAAFAVQPLSPVTADGTQAVAAVMVPAPAQEGGVE